MISLSLITRLISAKRSELTHTANSLSYSREGKEKGGKDGYRTLFSNQGVIAVVGIVRITSRRAAAVSKGAKVELWTIVRNWT